MLHIQFSENVSFSGAIGQRAVLIRQYTVKQCRGCEFEPHLEQFCASMCRMELILLVLVERYSPVAGFCSCALITWWKSVRWLRPSCDLFEHDSCSCLCVFYKGSPGWIFTPSPQFKWSCSRVLILIDRPLWMCLYVCASNLLLSQFSVSRINE